MTSISRPLQTGWGPSNAVTGFREQWLFGDGGSLNAAAVDDAIPAIIDEVEGSRQGLILGV